MHHAGVVGFLCSPVTTRLCALNVVSDCSVNFIGEMKGVVSDRTENGLSWWQCLFR